MPVEDPAAGGVVIRLGQIALPRGRNLQLTLEQNISFPDGQSFISFL